MALLDIVPTLYRFETIDQKAATGSWHWFFLIQARGFPERLIGSEAEFFLRHQLSALLRDPVRLEPEVFAEYLRCFRPRDHPSHVRRVPCRRLFREEMAAIDGMTGDRLGVVAPTESTS